MSSHTSPEPPVAVVMAAGRGTRMRSDRPKVLHEVAGRPLLEWVLEAARGAGCVRFLVVVGHGADEVKAAFPADDIEWVEQTEQLGTGHAVAQARQAVGDAGRVFVLSGDVPALRSQTLLNLIEAAEGKWGALSIARMDEPGALGRVVRGAAGRLERIVEAADATLEELSLDTINAGIYLLPSPAIFEYLARLRPDNAKGELYLTDALVAAAREHEVATVTIGDWREALGVNTRQDLAAIRKVLIDRHLDDLMSAGVTIHDPARTVIEPSVTIGKDSEIHPDVTLAGATSLGEGCVVHAGVWIRDSTVASGVSILPNAVVEGATLGERVSVGPFARLRPGADLAEDVRVGNFVEIKNARLERGVKAGHLAYLGDAEIGEETNIGAGAVTCNYDGEKKHRTRVGRRAFVGSDTMLVAPVDIGDEATTAAGSTITNDVPDGALGVSRSRQRTIGGWAKRRQVKGDQESSD